MNQTALALYTKVLGPQKKTEIPPAEPDGTELLLEPDGRPAVGPAVIAVLDDTCGNLIQIVSTQPE